MAYSARWVNAAWPVMFGTPAASSRVRRYSIRFTSVLRFQPRRAAAAA